MLLTLLVIMVLVSMLWETPNPTRIFRYAAHAPAFKETAAGPSGSAPAQYITFIYDKEWRWIAWEVGT